MVRVVILAGILAASIHAANAQDTFGNSGAGRVYAREVCSPCHAVTAEQASQRRIVIAPDFQTIANTSGMTGDCSSRLFADAASEDAEPDPYARAISRRNRLYVELTRRPTAASKTLTTGDGRSSMQLAPSKVWIARPAVGNRPDSTERLDVAD
jgi:hypothetical protein